MKQTKIVCFNKKCPNHRKMDSVSSDTIGNCQAEQVTVIPSRNIHGDYVPVCISDSQT